MLLFETIKVENGVLKNLTYHQSRVDDVFKNYFHKLNPFSLQELIVPVINSNDIYKCKFVYSDVYYEFQFSEYKRRPIHSLKCVYSDSINYQYKFLDRNLMDDLLKQKENFDDIIIIKNGFVTDCSYGNLVFCDGKSLFTPAHPLLAGTKRQKLLNEGKISEKSIKQTDLHKFQFVKIINAMLEIEDAYQITDFKNY